MLFSGPANTKRNLAFYFQRFGVDSTQVDILNTTLSDQDLLDDSGWLRYRKKLREGYYDAVFASPPCRTFSEARSVRPGPPVLRNHQFPYGFPRSQAAERGLSHGDITKIREDNLLAERTAEACRIIDAQCKPYAVEQPYPWQGGVCMFDLHSFRRLQSRGGQLVVFDQCRYDAPSTKPTQLLYKGASFGELEASCNHPKRQLWGKDGRSYMAAHPPVIQQQNPDGTYATKALAAYPPQLNFQIARIVSDALRNVSEREGVSY